METVSPQERARFLKANGGKEKAASEMLVKHLEWRATNMPHTRSQKRPEWIHWHGTAIDGSRVVHVLPARVDLELGTREEYGLDMASIIDDELDRDSAERITILVDARGGNGWANPAAPTMVPFIRYTAGVLSDNFPERVCKLVIYPLPRTLYWIWALVRPFLSRSVVDKALVLSGPGRPGPNAADEELTCPDGLSSVVRFDAFREDQAARHQDLRRRELRS